MRTPTDRDHREVREKAIALLKELIRASCSARDTDRAATILAAIEALPDRAIFDALDEDIRTRLDAVILKLEVKIAAELALEAFDRAFPEPKIETNCLDCGAVGLHHCEGVPGGFPDDDDDNK